MSDELFNIYEEELTPLHYELERFVSKVIPTPSERSFVEKLICVLEDTISSLVPSHACIKPFGSYPMGLAMHSSDLDLGILKVMKITSKGMNVRQKAEAVKILYAIAKKLDSSKVLRLSRMQIVAETRVPLLKIQTKESALIDVSLSQPTTIQAVPHVRQLLAEYPQSIPLIFALKCYLKEKHLNDVAFGGLGGYSLTNMVLAYCMEQRYRGRSDLDSGIMLLGFLKLFGFQFDYLHHAISSRRGQILNKTVLEKETFEIIRNTEGWEGRTNGKPLLFIEDPITYRNLARGTRRFREVQASFREAYESLMEDEDCDHRLSLMFDVNLATKRGKKCSNTLQPVKRVLRQERSVTRKMLRGIKEADNRRRQKRGMRRRARNCFLNFTSSQFMVTM